MASRFMTDPHAMRDMAGRFEVHAQTVEDEARRMWAPMPPAPPFCLQPPAVAAEAAGAPAPPPPPAPPLPINPALPPLPPAPRRSSG